MACDLHQISMMVNYKWPVIFIKFSWREVYYMHSPLQLGKQYKLIQSTMGSGLVISISSR